MVDDLAATFLGACAIDQIGVADRFTVRLGARQHWWAPPAAPSPEAAVFTEMRDLLKR
jgi:hypothetical protein